VNSLVILCTLVIAFVYGERPGRNRGRGGSWADECSYSRIAMGGAIRNLKLGRIGARAIGANRYLHQNT